MFSLIVLRKYVMFSDVVDNIIEFIQEDGGENNG